MPGLRADVDPEGLLEYSVVFTDRSLNHMSKSFQGVMQDISRTLKTVYGADAVAVVPGGGTFGMESVARQLCNDANVLIIRNGWFSYRWTQILEMAGIAKSETVLAAAPISAAAHAPFAPAPIEQVEAEIASQKPSVVFAPHVETSAGMILPDDYLRRVAAAVHAVGGLFVLDCIASGCIWVDMADVGVDVLISAPQKGWSGTPCAAQIMLSDRALARMAETKSTSFAADLNKWLDIMKAYENGGHAYHATMPTDGLVTYHARMAETQAMGFAEAKSAQVELGSRVRAVLASKGFASVAAPGFEAPGVVVSYTDNPDIKSGARFMAEGLQIAAGVPLMCGEGEGFSTFRLGLFGLDKLANVDAAVDRFEQALSRVLAG